MASAECSMPLLAPAWPSAGAAQQALSAEGLDVAARCSSAAAACLLVEIMPLVGSASSPTWRCVPRLSRAHGAGLGVC